MAQTYCREFETLTPYIKKKYVDKLKETKSCFLDEYKYNNTLFDRYVFIDGNKFIVIMFHWSTDKVEYIGVFDKLNDFITEW